MAVYVIVIALVVLVLVGAYRALGRTPAGAGDSAALLRSLHQQQGRSLSALASRLDGAADGGDDSEAAGEGRKVSAGVQQTLDRLPPHALLDNREAAARTLLTAAAEDTAWAWRMIQSPPTSPALATAARVLADHAAACCDEAGALLGTPLSSEPGDGA